MNFLQKIKWRLYESRQYEIVDIKGGYRLQRKDGTTDPDERLYTVRNDDGTSITYDLNKMNDEELRALVAREFKI